MFGFVGGDFFVLVFFLNMCFLWIVLLKGEMILKNYELEFEIMKVKCYYLIYENFVVYFINFKSFDVY